MRITQLGWVPALVAASLLLHACGDAREPPRVVESLTVSIDADNNCSLEDRPVECASVASTIHARYPTSKPRVDICLTKETRFEAATEVMNSVSAAGFTVGNFDCGKPAAG
jgi:biopolymer transport protein ExbD